MSGHRLDAIDRWPLTGESEEDVSILVDDIMVVGFRPRLASVRATLALIDPVLLRCLRDRETSIRVLSPLERFGDVDANCTWRTDEERCTLGIFNPSRNHIVLRDVSGAVLSHEAFHVIDHELGSSGRFRSHDDPAIVAAYAKHRKDGMWVSAYSSVAVHELAAEAGRSVLGFSTSATLKKRSDAERLRLIDPELMRSIDAMVVELRSRYGPGSFAPPSVLGTAAQTTATSDGDALA